MVYTVYQCRSAKQELKLQCVKSDKWGKSLKKDLFDMAHISSEIQGVYPKDESVGSETPIRPPSCDYTLTGDQVLKYITQDDAFQALYAESVIKRPCYTFSVFKPDELNDFLSLTFPQKQEYI